MSDTEQLFPDLPSLYDPLPDALRTGERGLHAVAGKYKGALREMPLETRRFASLLYLAHNGKLVDSQGRMKFDLTPAELAAWYKVVVGEAPAPNSLQASVVALKERGLAEFYTRRECRREGEVANTYRFAHHVFPVTAEEAQ